MDKLFDIKRTYIAYDGDEYIDMCLPVVSIKDMTGNATERANLDDSGRIDRFVWRNVAEDLDMIDDLMYANHIFNPFSIKDGDILNVPVQNDSLYRSSDEPSLPDGTKHSNNVSGEKTRTYAETVEYLAKKGLGWK